MNAAAKCHTLDQLLDRAAAVGGERAGIYWNDALISYAALAQDTLRIAGGLMARGIRRGDQVALWSPNSPGYVAAFFACARVGAAVMIVNTKLSSVELGDILRRSEAKAIFYDPDHPDSGFLQTLRNVERDTLAGLQLIVELDGKGETRPVHDRAVVGLDELRRAAPGAETPATADTPALLYSTSGSTGPSKLVVHTHATLTTHAQDVAAARGCYEQDTVHLIVLPLAGAYAMSNLLCAIASCKPIVLLEKLEPEAMAHSLKHYRVTHINVIDEVLIKLFEVCKEARPFPSLRSCAYGAFNAAYPDFEGECERRGIPIVGLYGSSETQACFVVQKVDSPLAERKRRGGYTVSPAAKYRVRDPETGELVGRDVLGEIELWGPSLMVKYYGNPEATKKAIREDGYYRTGDTGRIASDGSLVFEARIEEVLRLSGYMVAVWEIESFVCRVPGVASCQVVGISTREGNRPVAFVIVKRGERFDAETARAECMRGLARFKVPIAFHVVEEFPMGKSLNAPKVDKKRLRELATDSYNAASAP